MTQSHLWIRPCPLKAAHAYVQVHHRHHKPAQGGLWAVAVCDETGRVCGVAVVGRPVARLADDGRTIEVTRLATDGTPNACSCLLGAVSRYAKGFRLRAVTYTLPEEGGKSLHAAGWKPTGQTHTASDPKGWARQGPGRSCAHPQDKVRWVADFRDDGPALVWPGGDDAGQLALLGSPNA